jgi:hypothetical protein
MNAFLENAKPCTLAGLEPTLSMLCACRHDMSADQDQGAEDEEDGAIEVRVCLSNRLRPGDHCIYMYSKV